MKHRRLLLQFLFFAIVLLSSCSSENNQKQALRIATAANMQFAMTELTTQFSEETGIPCDMVVSSSGKLTAQILQGAPFDLFVAANMIYPEEIYSKGFAKASPKVYALGKLVLWSTLEGLEPSVALLATQRINHIAVPNPETAPYGIAALEFLKKNQLEESLKEKLVFGESVASTNQFINSKAVELGFTAKAVVLSPAHKGKGQWTEIENSEYSPIQQGLIQIKREQAHPKSSDFLDFLFTDTAKEILRKYGYEVL